MKEHKFKEMEYLINLLQEKKKEEYSKINIKTKSIKLEYDKVDKFINKIGSRNIINKIFRNKDMLKNNLYNDYYRINVEKWYYKEIEKYEKYLKKKKDFKHYHLNITLVFKKEIKIVWFGTEFFTDIKKINTEIDIPKYIYKKQNETYLSYLSEEIKNKVRKLKNKNYNLKEIKINNIYKNIIKKVKKPKLKIIYTTDKLRKEYENKKEKMFNKYNKEIDNIKKEYLPKSVYKLVSNFK